MSDEKTCSTEACSTEKKCCAKKFLFTAIATFALSMVYDWFVHGKLLMAQYEATASLWRPMAEMEAMMPYCLAYHGLQAVVFSCLFLCWKKHQTFGALCTSQCPVRRGFFFGGKIGLMLGLGAASAYISLPMPQELALSWLAAETAKWALIGGVLAWACHRCSKQ